MIDRSMENTPKESGMAPRYVIDKYCASRSPVIATRYGPFKKALNTLKDRRRSAKDLKRSCPAVSHN
jgi:hypothetical protein